MRTFIGVIVAGLMMGCAGHGTPGTTAVSNGSGRAGVMQADIDFAQVTAERRLDGWMSYMADDAVKAPWDADFIEGRRAIRKVDAATFADSTISLEWKPTDGGVYSDGRYGYTKGRYEVIKRAGGTRTVMGRGTYLTVWRREADGWKVVLDTGVPDSKE